MALHLNTKGLVALYLFNNMKEKFLTSSFLATSFAQSINKLKSLIKKGIKYYLVSFVVVLTATAMISAELRSSADIMAVAVRTTTKETK